MKKNNMMPFKFLTTVFLLGAVNVQADQVILDDLIVDGSACIGFDCVNGESFAQPSSMARTDTSTRREVNRCRVI